jgi:hypothetical protein
MNQMVHEGLRGGGTSLTVARSTKGTKRTHVPLDRKAQRHSAQHESCGT